MQTDVGNIFENFHPQASVSIINILDFSYFTPEYNLSVN